MEPDSDLKSVEHKLIDLASQVSGTDSIDPQTRQALQKATQKLSLALETPGDTFQRIAFLVKLSSFAPLQTTVVRIALDLGLFEILEQAKPNGKSTQELEKDTGADPLLLTRLLRYLAITGVIEETGRGQYAATPISKGLLSPVSSAGVKHNFDFVTPAFLKLPAYFAKTKYQNPTKALDGPFQYAYDTPMHGFAWIQQPENSALLNNFNTWLTGSGEGRLGWLEWFPLNEEVVKGMGTDKQAVAVVDVGGGLGHELLALKKKNPDLPGRLVLQDLSETIKTVPETTVFETMVHDFFTTQPIKGARVYYLRNVLHDWQTTECQLILKNIIAAMRKDYSKIIINEMVIPDVGARWAETHWDWTMLACLSAMERTEQQWRDLLTPVGLKVVKIWTHPDSTESIIEAVPV